jgi:hypothetical protein
VTDGRLFSVKGFIQGLIDDDRASIAYGHPYMIDVQDCDTRLPSSGDFNDVYMDELVRLSILLGRVQKTIYRFVNSFIIVYQPALILYLSVLLASLLQPTKSYPNCLSICSDGRIICQIT